jgi:hypothetical protein
VTKATRPNEEEEELESGALVFNVIPIRKGNSFSNDSLGYLAEHRRMFLGERGFKFQFIPIETFHSDLIRFLYYLCSRLRLSRIHVITRA